MLLLSGLIAAWLIFCIWYAYDWVRIILKEDSNSNQ